MCTALVTMLKSRAGHEKIFFENIVAPSFTPQRNAGIQKKDAVRSLVMDIAAAACTRLTRALSFSLRTDGYDSRH